MSNFYKPWMLAYVLTILVLNFGFAYVPMVDLGFGMLSPMAVVAGAVFVVRDFAQRESGHWVLLGMAVAAVLTFLLANPFVAFASVAAFASSEVVDYLLYTFTNKPFHKRVLISSLLSTPIDTAVFLYFLDGLTVGTFVLMVAAKLLAALVIWYRGQTRSTSSLRQV